MPDRSTLPTLPQRATPPELAWRLVTLAAVVFALSSALYAAWRQGWTYDEPFHLEWTERLLVERNAGRESPHYNAKTPILLPNVLLNRAAARATASEPLLRFASRLPSVLWLALLLLAVHVVGRRLFGPTAGRLATIAAALDPNLVAHGSVVTVDVMYALGTLLTVAGATAFGSRPSAARAALLGLALGLALSAKFSAILLMPVLLLAPVLARPGRREWPRWLAGALVVAAVAALVVCSAYLFLDVARPLASQHWLSKPMRRLAHALPWLRLPVPTAFLTGYDVSLAAERGEWNVVILGRWYPHGVWFYFALLWLLKTPVLVLLAEIGGLVMAAASRVVRGTLGARLLFATLVVHLAYFSLVFRTQVGYRFVLMCIPIAYLLAAAGLASRFTPRPLNLADRATAEEASEAPRPGGRRNRLAVAGSAVLAVALLENAMYLGNPLSFTNAVVWPKKQAFRLIADSNIDWGQHDAEMEAWSRRPGGRVQLNPLHLLPGRDTFSVNEIAGLPDFERHRFLRANAEPAGHIGHTHVWFEVDEALFDRFLDAERRLEPRAEDAAACPPTTGGEALAPGAPLHEFLGAAPQARAGWLVCAAAPMGADLGLRSRGGRATLGRYRAGTPCEGETIEPGQESWHRLLPGTHALCVLALPGADPSLTGVFEGAWLARRGTLSLGRVPAPVVPAPVVDAPAGPR